MIDSEHPSLTTRLYISPFTQATFSSIIPPSLVPLASGHTYCSIPTFPEKSFGYVDLPSHSANALRQKLNGSYLKGVKIRIEEARAEPSRSRSDSGTQLGMAKDQSRRGAPTGQKRKPSDGVLKAVELPEGRRVKRGWTEQSSANASSESNNKRQRRSAEKDKPSKVLFRTALPANVASKHPDLATTPSKSKRPKRSARSKVPVEVEEFDKAIKNPSFLRSSSEKAVGNPASEFVEGVGWVDENGVVVEPVKPRRTAKTARPQTPKTTSTAKPVDSNGIDGNHSQDSAASHVDQPLSNDSAESQASLSDDQSDQADEPESKAVHPLEALYKSSRTASSTANNETKSQQRPARIQTSFSFFNGNDDDVDDSKDGDEDDDEEDSDHGAGGGRMLPPQTPFTKLDMEFRGIRSAAPTPDTAAIDRRFKVPWADSSSSWSREPSEEFPKSFEALSETPIKLGPSAIPAVDTVDEGAGQTDFEKHFWASRGEYNRSWKARKREARKEKRQAENRNGALNTKNRA